MTSKDNRCFGGYLVAFGGQKVRCELPRRHKGACGPDRAQYLEKQPARHQETSRLAYQSVLPVKGTIAAKVLNVIEAGPSTTEEVEGVLDMKHQTISAAISNLWHKEHLIQPNGKRRLTTSGRFADVYERVA